MAWIAEIVGANLGLEQNNWGQSNRVKLKDYELKSLSEEVKGQLASLQFVDAELQRLNAQAAVLQTARAADAKALNEALAKKLAADSKPDTSQLTFG